MNQPRYLDRHDYDLALLAAGDETGWWDENGVGCRGDFGQRMCWCDSRCHGYLLVPVVDFVRPAVP